ncbi:MAG: L-fucose isomerase [Clostridia bacterium]|nr:L-fucose isomerase [Clostridia bacterium]
MKCKIGIRPTIDARQGGVREGLEEQTMALARSAKRLIEQSVRYSDSEPVEVVLSPCTIGGGAEAARCAEYFARENVCATLTVTPCWCYGSETMDLDPLTVKAVWGFNGTERPGAVYLAAVMAAHAQRGLPAFSIYGRDVQDAGDDLIPSDVQEKILRFARCAIAVGQMRGRSYTAIGGVSMGIAGSFLDPNVIQDYFGMRAEWVDMVEIIRRERLGIYDPEEYDRALSWAKAGLIMGKDHNPEWGNPPFSQEEKREQLEYAIKMTLIIRDIMQGNPSLEGEHPEEARGKNAIAGGFQGQRQWTDFMPNGDLTEAILNSSFDWRGKREPFILATENDWLNAISMLLGKLLTHRASVFADVRTYWSVDAVKRVTGWLPRGRAERGFIHLLNSGAAALDGSGACKDANGGSVMKPWWEVTEWDIDAMLKAVRWYPANRGYFRGGGFSSGFSSTGEMPATMVRLNYVKGVGLTMQLAQGHTVSIPDEVGDALLKRTDPTWPSTWFVPDINGKGAFSDVYSVMAGWGANHCALIYGHVGQDLVTLASMLRIPVVMHNLKDPLMRPHSWSQFSACLDAADRLACDHYGPLYR